MKKRLVGLATILITLLIIGGSIFLVNQRVQETPEELAKCIGENSIVYTQLGCHACKTQEDLFGESYQYLTEIDCFYEQQECIIKNITATPTWIINGKKYVGVQSIEELKEATGC